MKTIKETITYSYECPKCGKKCTGRPEVSLLDYITLICPDCHIEETLDTLGIISTTAREHIKKTVRMQINCNIQK